MRLDAFLSRMGHGSRSQVRTLIKAGRVAVDGVIIWDGGFSLDPQKAAITLDGGVLPYLEALHLMMNKPAGVVTAAADPRHQTVLSLLPKVAQSMGCMPVGRLDKDTEGLLLFTTDGTLCHRLLSPKRHVDKVYQAMVDGPLSQADVAAFSKGIQLSDFVALPAKLVILPGENAAHVTLREGKFHQVKRMFHARGREVLSLRRLSFGGIPLDESLTPGESRELTEGELSMLWKAAGGHTDE